VFRKRNKDQQCNHKFYVLKVFSGGEGLMQLLQCKICYRKFWGYAGTYGNPKWTHEVPQRPNLIETSRVE